MNSESDASGSNHSNGSQQIPPANSTLNQARAPQPLRVPTSESNNNGNLENHKQLRIYVSKFHPETECMDIVNHIGSKTSLAENEHFLVTKLTKNNRKYPLSFVSFMITAHTKETYDTIIASDVWGQFVATAFEPRDKTEKKHKKKTGNQVVIPDQTKEQLKHKDIHKKPRKPLETVQPKKKHRSEPAARTMKSSTRKNQRERRDRFRLNQKFHPITIF